MTAVYYEIRIVGPVPPGALRGFEQLTADLVPAETLLRGLLPDRAALNGLLARLESFGVELVGLRKGGGEMCAPRAPARPPGPPDRTAPAVTPGR
ncbi:MAG TPA: hypothetical protein VKV33_09695 [Streptosporangiaceae bacterium]|nr:hypothetical protein [Streptosporangiaceae bacterium]